MAHVIARRLAPASSRVALRSPAATLLRSRLSAAPIVRRFMPAMGAGADVPSRSFFWGKSKEVEETKNDMFCFQCEQTDGGTGCTTVGICGKDPTTAALQDALVYAVKGIAVWAVKARAAGVSEEALADANEFTLLGLFSTLTNVNFDADAIHAYIGQALKHRDNVKALALAAGATEDATTAADAAGGWVPADSSLSAIADESKGSFGVEGRRAKYGADIAGVQELIVYGLKGAAAYAAHASRLGSTSPEAFKGIHEALAVVASGESDVGKLVETTLGVGGTNLGVLKMLDEAHTTKFGHPEPTAVNHKATAGKAILVSGHDIADLVEILEQTKDKGINVYTHGELLPAHGYPAIKKDYPHLVGNYGGPWQLQKFDFSKFPGPIVMTTNCLIEPRKAYKGRLFTAGATGWPGCKHIEDHDYSEVIECALAEKGFPKTEEPKTFLTGFGHNTVLSVADQVIKAATEGDLKRIVLIGGCDGTESERSYYTNLATGLPDESLILTLGCGKFRLLGKKDYGTLPGTDIPRLLDMGQCNDSYSAIAVAVALADALKTDVNSLPLSIVLSWFEQKAVAVLLTLLHLGVKDIRIGPALPAFIEPGVLQLLVDNFNLTPIPGDSAPNVEEVMIQ